MPNSPKDIGELASYLFDLYEAESERSEIEKEALRRAVVGRYYYAILKETEDFYEVQERGWDEHSNIIKSMADSEQQNILSTMRALRRKADYSLDQTVLHGDVWNQKLDYEDITDKLIDLE